MATLLGPVFLTKKFQSVTSEAKSALHASIHQPVSSFVGLSPDMEKRDSGVRQEEVAKPLQPVCQTPAVRYLILIFPIQQTFGHLDEGVGVAFYYRQK